MIQAVIRYHSLSMRIGFSGLLRIKPVLMHRLFIGPVIALNLLTFACDRELKSEESGESAKFAAAAENTLGKSIRFFHSIAIRGGYVYHYSLDLSEKWGEGRTGKSTIEVQPPGTPSVGMSFLRAFRITDNPYFLTAAEEAAAALILGQNDLGGWEHKIHFDRPKGNSVSFDDNQTQSAILFLMELDRTIDDPGLSEAIEAALKMMLESQLENGGWPHIYPKQGNYHDHATFNDRGINDCIAVMIDAHRYYGRSEYLASLHAAGSFILNSQLSPPQPGWAQQYDERMQPAWARDFEPPSVCPFVTLHNINSLIDLYLYTGRDVYLDPISEAIRWVEKVRLSNGKWPRFAELGSDEPLYYDRGRIRVSSVDSLHIERRTGYGYEQDLTIPLERSIQRFDRVKRLKTDTFPVTESRLLTRDEKIAKLRDLVPQVEKVISSIDELGRWVTKNDRYRSDTPGRRWNGEYTVKDRISSAVFNRNVNILCDYLELCKALEE